MNKVRMFPTSILMLLYNSFILPDLNYCMIVWGNTYNCNSERILKLQKKAIRIISHSQYLSHTNELFHSLKLLKYDELLLYQSAIFMFLCFNDLLPPDILKCFNFNNDIHSYNTRNSELYHIPKVRTNASKLSIFYNGPITWNSLPQSIRSSPSLNSFKRKYKNCIMVQTLLSL